MEVQKEDLGSSCLVGRSGEGSAGECSLTQHGLPPIVIGCITHACTKFSYSAPVTEQALYIMAYNGFWKGDTGQLLLWTFNGQCKVDRFGVESML